MPVEPGGFLPKTGGTMTGVLKLPDGTALAPAATFASDMDTGIYLETADVFAISSAGSQCVRFFNFGAAQIQVQDQALNLWNTRTGAGDGFNTAILGGWTLNGHAGNVTIQGGVPLGTDKNGADVRLLGTAGTGTGTTGKVVFRDSINVIDRATMDTTGHLLVGPGTAALPSLSFLAAPTVGFFNTLSAIGVAVAGVWTIQLSAFGAGLVIFPDRAGNIFPQRQTAGVGDIMRVGGGTALGGTNAGGDLRLSGGAAAGAGTPGSTLIRNAADTITNTSFNDAGDMTVINGDLAYNRKTMTLANGTNNNVVNTAGIFYKVSGPTGVFTITGLVAGTDGQVLEILNLTTFAMTMAHENASSTAANRITTMTGANVATVGNGYVRLLYDTSTSRWALIAPTA